ncbi:MAG: hypothetical protein ABL860_00305, partial [Candidatus Nitrotoga sp.]
MLDKQDAPKERLATPDESKIFSEAIDRIESPSFFAYGSLLYPQVIADRMNEAGIRSRKVEKGDIWVTRSYQEALQIRKDKPDSVVILYGPRIEGVRVKMSTSAYNDELCRHFKIHDDFDTSDMKENHYLLATHDRVRSGTDFKERGRPLHGGFILGLKPKEIAKVHAYERIPASS